MRSDNLKKANRGMNVISSDLDAHPDVDFRYILWESKSSVEGHGGKSSLKFDGEYTWPM